MEYIGQIYNDKLEGFGLLVQNGRFYEGKFKEGLKEGYGRQIIFAGPGRGNVFEG